MAEKQKLRKKTSSSSAASIDTETVLNDVIQLRKDEGTCSELDKAVSLATLSAMIAVWHPLKPEQPPVLLCGTKMGNLCVFDKGS